MTANELRIGNYINQDNQPTRIYHIECRGNGRFSINDVFYDSRRLTVSFDEIPISIDLILKIGFNETLGIGDTRFFYKLIGVRTEYNGVQCYELTICKSVHGDWFINLEEQYFGYCRYLHELQNKYFSICGEEIEFEL